MSIELSEALENIINSKSGIPSHRVTVYDTMFPWKSKGLFATYYRLIKVGGITSKSRIDSIHVFGEDMPYVDGVPIRTDYVSQLRFWWGKGYPPGITEDMIGKRGWGARFSGYFMVPSNGRYSFRIFSSLYCRVVIAGTEVISGKDPHGFSTQGTIYLNGGYSVPIDIYIAQTSGMDGGATMKKEDSMLLVEWRVEGDDFNWKPIDVGYFSPGATAINTVGNAIDTSLSILISQGSKFFASPTVRMGYESLIGQAQDTMVPAQGSWVDGEEYILSFSHKYGDTYTYYVNGIEKGEIQSYTISTITIDGDKKVTLSWGEIEQNSSVVIRAPGYLTPLVSSNGLPHIQEITEERTEGQSTTFSFKVPLTQGKWNPRYITPDNCYSYDPSTQSMGVLRKHRLVQIEQGYSEQLVTRFIGFISDIEVSDTAMEPSINVTCLDLSKLLVDGFITEAPDKVSWMRFGSGTKLSDYRPNEYIRDTMYLPKCYDAWNLSDMVKDLLYISGLSSRTVAALDNNDQSYIVDNGSRLSKSIDYPHEMIQTPLGDVRESSYKWVMEIGSSFWDVLKRIETEFGRPFKILPNGEFDFRLPDNPNLLKLYYDPADPYANSEKEAINTNERIIPKVTPEKNVRGIRGFFYTQYGDSKDAWKITFEGQGLALIVARPDRSHEIQVEVDGVIIDGATALDEDTGDTGDIEYTTLLTEDKWYPLKLKDNNGNPIEMDEYDGFWAWSNGTHPALGYNPCILPICRNLTWGSHTVSIHTRAIGNVRLDGAFIYKDNKNSIARILSASNDIISISINESDSDIRNTIIVMGTQTDRAGNPIMVKSVNSDSISNPNSPTYLGRERPLIVINGAVVTQSKAEFIANYLLNRHSRVIRNPSLEMVAVPSLLEGDCISIIDYRVGMRLPITIQTGSRILTMEPSKGEKYWINSLSSNMNQNNWTMQLQVTPFSPMSAYTPTPDPPDEIWDENLIANIKIYLKNAGEGIEVFNPYEEDITGERVVLEFDLPWNARAISIGVYNKTLYNFCVYPFYSNFLGYIIDDDLITSLLWNEDFLEAGHYKLEWNGWWSTGEEEGDMAKGGRYVPQSFGADPAEFYFKIYVQREKDGKVMWYTTDNVYPTSVITANHPKYIITDDSGYNGSNTCTFPSEQIFVAHPHIDYYIYDDIANQPSDPGTFLTKVSLNRPSSFQVKCFIYLLQAFLFDPGDNIDSTTVVKIIEGFPLSIFVTPEILPAGEYSIAFSPFSMLRNMEGMLSDAETKIWAHQMDIHNLKGDEWKSHPFMPGLGPDTNIPFNYIYPRSLYKSGQYQYNAWLFYFPSVWGIGGAAGGFLTMDKNAKLFSNSSGLSLGTSDNPNGIFIQWFGDRTIFSNTKTSIYNITINLPLGSFNVDPVGSKGKTNWDIKRQFTIGQITFSKVYEPI